MMVLFFPCYSQKLEYLQPQLSNPRKLTRTTLPPVSSFFEIVFFFLSAIWSSHGQDGTLSPAEGLVGFKPSFSAP